MNQEDIQLDQSDINALAMLEMNYLFPDDPIAISASSFFNGRLRHKPSKISFANAMRKTVQNKYRENPMDKDLERFDSKIEEINKEIRNCNKTEDVDIVNTIAMNADTNGENPYQVSILSYGVSTDVLIDTLIRKISDFYDGFHYVITIQFFIKLEDRLKNEKIQEIKKVLDKLIGEQNYSSYTLDPLYLRYDIPCYNSYSIS